MDLEAGCILWSIRHLRQDVFGVFFSILNDHECLLQVFKIRETKPRTQHWIEFLLAYNLRLPYRRGKDNATADFLSQLPIPPTKEDISGSSALSGLGNLGVYLIRACGLTTTPFCPTPGLGLDGLALSLSPASEIGLDWLVPQPEIPLSGRLPLTNDDFQTYNVRLLSPHMVGLVYQPYTIPTENPTLPMLFDRTITPPGPPIHDAHEAKPRSWQVEPHHVRTTTSTASALPPLRASPPTRSTRLDSTTPSDC